MTERKISEHTLEILEKDIDNYDDMADLADLRRSSRSAASILDDLDEEFGLANLDQEYVRELMREEELEERYDLY